MSRFAKGKYTLKNPEKYIGIKTPTYRSSWEWQFMNFCDTHSSIQKWASEPVKIPYRNPLTNKVTMYVPDFFIQYLDKKGSLISEIIEIKPKNQQLLENVGKNKIRQAQYIVNQSKWASASVWCKKQNLGFRVLNESDIFHQGKKR